MSDVLDYCPPEPRARWAVWFSAALWTCVPGVAVVVGSGLVSTLAMRYFQLREGRTVLTGPGDRWFQMWVGGIPFVLATGLLAAIWGRAVWRRGRGDRLAVAIMAAYLLGCLWFAAYIWIGLNGEIAYP